MSKYKHWLKINGCTSDTKKQYREIENYLKEYPESKATIYQNNYSLFDWVILLECNQNYNDLDMNVNSGFNNLRRLSRKPSNIEERTNIIIKDYEISFLE